MMTLLVWIQLKSGPWCLEVSFTVSEFHHSVIVAYNYLNPAMGMVQLHQELHEFYLHDSGFKLERSIIPGLSLYERVWTEVTHLGSTSLIRGGALLPFILFWSHTKQKIFNSLTNTYKPFHKPMHDGPGARIKEKMAPGPYLKRTGSRSRSQNSRKAMFFKLFLNILLS